MGISKKRKQTDADTRIQAAIDALNECRLLPADCNRFVQHNYRFREQVQAIREKYDGRLYQDDPIRPPTKRV